MEEVSQFSLPTDIRSGEGARSALPASGPAHSRSPLLARSRLDRVLEPPVSGGEKADARTGPGGLAALWFGSKEAVGLEVQ